MFGSQILRIVNVNGRFIVGVALLLILCISAQNDHRQSFEGHPMETGPHSEYVGENQRPIDTPESRAVHNDNHRNPSNVPPPAVSQQNQHMVREPPFQSAEGNGFGTENTIQPESQKPLPGRPPVVEENNMIHRDHQPGDLKQASPAQNSQTMPSHHGQPPNARFQETPSGSFNSMDNTRNLEADKQRNSVHGNSAQPQHPELNRAPIQNPDRRETRSPTQSSTRSENSHGAPLNSPEFREQNLNREHPPPPHFQPSHPNFAPDAFNQFRHDQMHHDDRLPIDQGIRRSRTDIPKEFLLDEMLLLPSLTYDSVGRPTHVPIGNDFAVLTVLVPPGVKECYFYEPVTAFRIDYQVIRGGGLDLGLFVRDPDGEPIAIRPPVPDASIVINVPPHFRMKPYAICLDNRKGTYAEKQTYLSLDLELNWSDPDPYERSAIEFLQRKYTSNSESEEAVSQYIENLQKFMGQLDGLHGRLRQIEHLQQRSNNFGLVDKALMEANLDRVTQGSITQILVMLGVAGLQILVIRSLFDPNSRLYGFWFGKRPSSRATC